MIAAFACAVARAACPRQHGQAARATLVVVVLALFAPLLGAAEVIPPAPRDHFNDYAGVVNSTTAATLERELTQFERDTSNQIIVAIFPKMQSDSSIEDYTVRVFQAWHVGQQGKNNGAVLFVFRDDHKVWIATGYGLEGAIPDARAKQIIENEITPRFRNGDFSGGAAAGTRALMAAARGEYRGTGRTAADRRRGNGGGGGSIFPLFFVFLIIVIVAISRRRRGVVYGRSGRRGVWVNSGPWWWGGGGGGGGWGGGGGGSGWSGGGGGSFSGGGGSTGGGGAGGSW